MIISQANSETPQNNRKKVHLRTHAHLLNCIHLKHQNHARNAVLIHQASNMGGANDDQLSLLKEIAHLLHSPTLKDPSTTSLPVKSPRLQSLLHKIENELCKHRNKKPTSTTTTTALLELAAEELSRRKSTEHTRDWKPSELLDERETDTIMGLGRDTSDKFASINPSPRLTHTRQRVSVHDTQSRNNNYSTSKSKNVGRARKGKSNYNKNRKGGSEEPSSKYLMKGKERLNPNANSGEGHPQSMGSLKGFDGQVNSNSNSNNKQGRSVGGDQSKSCGMIPWNCSRISHRNRRKDFDDDDEEVEEEEEEEEEEVGEEEEEEEEEEEDEEGEGEGEGEGEEVRDLSSRICDHRLGKRSMGTDSESIETDSSSSEIESLPLLQDSNSESHYNKRAKQLRSIRQPNEGVSPLMRVHRYLSLSRKYVPRVFSEIVGQAVVTRALKNALVNDKIASMYIFYGPRGTGKSCCARVFAMSLMCTSAKNREIPCGSCPECLAHLSGKTSVSSKLFTMGKQLARNSLKLLMQEMATKKNASSFSYYKAFILDECDFLSTQVWSAYVKLLDEAPPNVVFILCASNLEHLPPIIISRSQKFYFTKLKESEIVRKLKFIAAKEQLEIETDALKLVVASSAGSLQDAETTLEQLSLLGPNISTTMVQELIGLVPEEKVMDLLRFSLSRDTMSTVKSLKDLMDSGVEPVALISQLASLVTLILTRGYRPPNERNGHSHHFRNTTLTDKETETLRNALKILSEAEKQLRRSSDPWTWLTAALLQFASPNESNIESKEKDPIQIPSSEASTQIRQSNKGAQSWTRHNNKQRTVGTHADLAMAPQQNQVYQSPHRALKIPNPVAANHPLLSSYGNPSQQANGKVTDLEGIWKTTLDAMHSKNLRQLLLYHGKLLSLSFCKAFAMATIGFTQAEHRNEAERSSTSIAHAFQSTLGCLVEVRTALSDKRDKQIIREVFSDSSRIPPQATTMPFSRAVTNGEAEIRLSNLAEDEDPSNGALCPKGNHHKSHSFDMHCYNNNGILNNTESASASEQQRRQQRNYLDANSLQNRWICKGQQRSPHPSPESRLMMERDHYYYYNCGKSKVGEGGGSRDNERADLPPFPDQDCLNIRDGGLNFLKMREEEWRQRRSLTVVDSSPELSIEDISDKPKKTGFLCWKRTRGHRKERQVMWCR